MMDISLMGEKTPTDVPSMIEAVDEMSATSSSSTSTRYQETRLNLNANFPLLVYQYPIAQSNVTHVKGNNHCSQRVLDPLLITKNTLGSTQQRPVGVYLMPPQHYLTTNQYVVPYPQAGRGTHPVYYPSYEQTPVNHVSEWEAITNSNGYQSQRLAHNYQRGSSYRGNRGWSASRGRGHYHAHNDNNQHSYT